MAKLGWIVPYLPPHISTGKNPGYNIVEIGRKNNPNPVLVI
jgi:hypothetical protein